MYRVLQKIYRNSYTIIKVLLNPITIANRSQQIPETNLSWRANVEYKIKFKDCKGIYAKKAVTSQTMFKASK